MSCGQVRTIGKKALACVAALGMLGLGSCWFVPVLSAVATQEVTSVDQAAGDVLELRLNNVAGAITITATTDDRITLVATKKVLALSEGFAQSELDRIKIDVTGTEGPVLTVTVTQPLSTPALTFLSDWQIEVPADLKVTIDTSAGAVTATGLGNDVNVTTDAGAVNLATITGNVTVRTKAGEVTLTDVRGNVSAEVDAGSITATVTPPEAVDIDLKTNAGSINDNLAGFETENVTRTTALVNGELTADLNGGTGGTITLDLDVGSATFAGL